MNYFDINFNAKNLPLFFDLTKYTLENPPIPTHNKKWKLFNDNF